MRINKQIEPCQDQIAKVRVLEKMRFTDGARLFLGEIIPSKLPISQLVWNWYALKDQISNDTTNRDIVEELVAQLHHLLLHSGQILKQCGPDAHARSNFHCLCLVSPAHSINHSSRLHRAWQVHDFFFLF